MVQVYHALVLVKKAKTTQSNHPMLNGMAILSHEDTMLQCLADAYCSNVVH